VVSTYTYDDTYCVRIDQNTEVLYSRQGHGSISLSHPNQVWDPPSLLYNGQGEGQPEH
jgi:hypothetical protein